MRQIEQFKDYEIVAEYNLRFKSVRESVTTVNSSISAIRRALDRKGVEKDREHFFVLFLDGQNKEICTELLSSGTINTAAVYPREIIKKVLEHEAVSIVLGHNHPSGNIAPSNSDKTLTRKITVACTSIDVDVLDHIIIGGADTYSFADHRLL